MSKDLRKINGATINIEVYLGELHAESGEMIRWVLGVGGMWHIDSYRYFS